MQRAALRFAFVDRKKTLKGIYTFLFYYPKLAEASRNAELAHTLTLTCSLSPPRRVARCLRRRSGRAVKLPSAPCSGIGPRICGGDAGDPGRIARIPSAAAPNAESAARRPPERPVSRKRERPDAVYKESEPSEQCLFLILFIL